MFNKLLSRIRGIEPNAKKPERVETMYTYYDILLTTYLEITQTGNIDLLVYTGNPSEEEIQTRWDEIVKQNALANGHNEDNQLDNIRDYIRLLSTYVAVKASLLQLLLVVDDECLFLLSYKGYRIDTSSNIAYQESIQAALHKVKNVLSKLNSRHKLIMESLKASGDESVPIQNSAEMMLANVSAAMGFNVDSTVTLARFNEYNKIIKKRIEAQKEAKTKKS